MPDPYHYRPEPAFERETDRMINERFPFHAHEPLRRLWNRAVDEIRAVTMYNPADWDNPTLYEGDQA
jgi:hypothetical protein